MNIKILILGSRGFFGKNLKLLLQNTNYTLYFLDRTIADAQNIVQLNSIFTEFTPEVVINCCGIVGSSELNKELDQTAILNTNINLNTNVFTCCKNNNVKKLIVFSSYRIFPNNIEDGYDESKLSCLDFSFSHTNANNTGYLLSKKIMHLQIELMKQNTDIKIICLVLPNVFGLYDMFTMNGRIVPSFIHKINTAKEESTNLIINSDGRTMIDLIYMNDIVYIIDKCIKQSNITGDIIVFNENTKLTLEDLVNILAKKMNYIHQIVFTNVLSSKPPKLATPNNHKFNAYFEDFKFTDLNDSLQKTIDYYVNLMETLECRKLC